MATYLITCINMVADVEDFEAKEIMEYWKKREAQILNAMVAEANRTATKEKGTKYMKSNSVPVSPLKKKQTTQESNAKVHSSSSQLEEIKRIPSTTNLFPSPTSKQRGKNDNKMGNEQLDYYAKQGIHLFNTTPYYGIEFLLTHFFELDDIACLFYEYRDMIEPVRLGLWIADNPEITPRYLSMYNFKKQMPLEALSNILYYVQPAKGTKLLTTFLRAFVAKYIHDNKQFPVIPEDRNIANPAIDAYELYTLLYAAIMVHSECSHILKPGLKKVKKHRMYWTQKKFEKHLAEITKIPDPYIKLTYRKVMEGSLMTKSRSTDIELLFRDHKRIATFDNIKKDLPYPLEHNTVSQDRYLEKLRNIYNSKINTNENQENLSRSISSAGSNSRELINKPILSLRLNFDDNM